MRIQTNLDQIKSNLVQSCQIESNSIKPKSKSKSSRIRSNPDQVLSNSIKPKSKSSQTQSNPNPNPLKSGQTQIQIHSNPVKPKSKSSQIQIQIWSNPVKPKSKSSQIQIQTQSNPLKSKQRIGFGFDKIWIWCIPNRLFSSSNSNEIYFISIGDSPFKSYRVNGRTDTLTDRNFFTTQKLKEYVNFWEI